MNTYRHKVQYYETDRMGVTHHSNYIRWMEEARIDFLEQVGWPYQKLEEMGVSSPVTGVECKYKMPTTFADLVDIEVWIKTFNGVILTIGYRMRNAEDKVVCEGTSEHVFLNEKGMFIRLHRDYPELFSFLKESAEAAKA